MLRFTAAAVLLLTFSTTTLADLIIEARETGGDVVFTTSGSLDMTGWDYDSPSSLDAAINPSVGAISFGALLTDVYQLGSAVLPTSYGSGNYVVPSSGSGDRFGFYPNFATVFVEPGYQFGTPINATMTFDNATIDSLGINPGDTVWSWSVEPVAFDVKPVGFAPTSSITLRAIAIPEPSAFACLGLIGLVAGGRSWWKRRR